MVRPRLHLHLRRFTMRHLDRHVVRTRYVGVGSFWFILFFFCFWCFLVFFFGFFWFHGVFFGFVWLVDVVFLASIPFQPHMDKKERS